MTVDTVQSPWLTLRQSAKYLHMDEGRMRALVRSGEIQSRRHGASRGTLVHSAWLDAWMMEQPSAAMAVASSTSGS